MHYAVFEGGGVEGEWTFWHFILLNDSLFYKCTKVFFS